MASKQTRKEKKQASKASKQQETSMQTLARAFVVTATPSIHKKCYREMTVLALAISVSVKSAALGPPRTIPRFWESFDQVEDHVTILAQECLPSIQSWLSSSGLHS